MKPFVIPASVAAAVAAPPVKVKRPRKVKKVQPTAAKRQADAKARLLKDGGARKSYNLTAQALADIHTIMGRGGHQTAQDAVIAALRAHAQQE